MSIKKKSYRLRSTHGLPRKEIKIIETRRKREQDKRHREYEKHEKLHEQTLKEKIENLIVFHGNNLHPLPENIFSLYKTVIERQRNKEVPHGINTRELVNVCDRNSSDIECVSEKGCLKYYHYSYENWDYCEDKYYYPFNSTIGISLYHDYEINQDLFYITLSCDGADIDKKHWVNLTQHIFYANNKLREIYTETKKFRQENSNKYIQLYKNTKIQDFVKGINAYNQILCSELCLFSEHCNRLACLLPESQIHEVKTPEMYKINLHILEPCNFKCRHCFAHFDNNKTLKVNEWLHVVDNCADALYVNEFNIAGGEPLIYKDLPILAQYIRYKGARLSIITNGFLMSNEWIDKNAKYYNTIGFSIDSFIPDIQIEQGRCTSDKKILTLDRFKEICLRIHNVSPETKLKINTVVTALNKSENIAASIKTLQKSGVKISRWKIIRMDIFKNESFDNSDIAISDEEYKDFAKLNLKEFKTELGETSLIHIDENGMDIVVEEDVAGAYIMIDANGNLVDNTKNLNYVSLINCVTENFEEGMKQLSFDHDLYFSRYRKE